MLPYDIPSHSITHVTVSYLVRMEYRKAAFVKTQGGTPFDPHYFL